MAQPSRPDGVDVARLIHDSGISIYDSLHQEDPRFFDILSLEELLDERLAGKHLAYELRTRAKMSKSLVAEAMGYPVPGSFRKTQPRFPGQNLDVFVQKSNNVQIWNEEVDPERRYAMIGLDVDSRVTNVRVVTGEALALLDRTGTLTQKYQAARIPGSTGSKLVTLDDTGRFKTLMKPSHLILATNARKSPSLRPVPCETMTIAQIYEVLIPLVGRNFDYGEIGQERARGAKLHRLVSEALGYPGYADTGQFPDILHQALEVKLQTSRTIDLGLVAPDSDSLSQMVGGGIRHCDIRYAIVYASRVGHLFLRIDDVVVSTGEKFFSEFQRFEGNIINRKLQIRLPLGFFG